jgi:hypothetical protein
VPNGTSGICNRAMKHAFTTTRGGIDMEIGGSKYINGSARRRPEP